MPLTQQVPPIAGGCHYALQVAVSCNGEGPFPTGAATLARLRDYEGAAVVATLSTADGSLYLVDDQTIELQIPAATTALLSGTSALVEFTADGPDPEAIGIALRLPVIPAFRAVLGSSTAIVLSLYDVTLTACPVRQTAAAPPPPPPPAAPTFAAAPAITATVFTGEPLAGVDPEMSGGTISTRAWLLAGAAISGATGAGFTPEQPGQYVYQVEATGPGGTTTATSAPVLVVADPSPTPAPAPAPPPAPPLTATIDTTLANSTLPAFQVAGFLTFAQSILDALNSAASTAGVSLAPITIDPAATCAVMLAALAQRANVLGVQLAAQVASDTTTISGLDEQVAILEAQLAAPAPKRPF